MMRGVQSGRSTQVVPHYWPLMVLTLKNAPVTSVQSLKFSTIQDFVSEQPLTAGTDYVVDFVAGTINLLFTPPYLRQAGTGRPVHPTYAQIIYTGGFAADTDTFITAYPDLAAACDWQVRYLWQRRDSMGGQQSTKDASTQFTKDYTWLPNVARLLHYYRRRNL